MIIFGLVGSAFASQTTENERRIPSSFLLSTPFQANHHSKDRDGRDNSEHGYFE